MELLGVRAVMVFADEPTVAARWWSSLTGREVNEAEGFAWLDLPGGIELGFHPADDQRNPRGGSPVIYSRTAGKGRW